LPLLGTPEAEAELDQKISEARLLFQGGDVARAQARLRIASVGAFQSRLHAVRGRALVLLASIVEDSGNVDAAMDLFREAEEALAYEPVGERFEVVAGIARCCNASGRSAYAIELLESYLQQLEKSGQFAPTAGMRAYSSLIPCYKARGMTRQATNAAEKALRFAGHVDDQAQIACMKMNVSWVLVDRGDLSEAIKTISDAEQIYTQLNWSISAARARLNRGVIESERGDLEVAQATLKDAVTQLRPEGPTKMDRAYALDELGRVERLMGLTEIAEERFREARPLLEQRDRLERGLNARELAMCLAPQDREEAVREFRAAIEHYEAAGAASQVATTAHLLARLEPNPDQLGRAVHLDAESKDSEV
jgi:tetratricopeptide (TPR) repeat protein